MAVVGELEGLVSSHKMLISRGSIIEAAKVKELIGGYLAKKDRYNRLFRSISEKLHEFIYCAETNFEKFQEIINFKMLTQMEYFYLEYFGELTDNIEESAKKNIATENYYYVGLLLGSSRTADNKILLKVIDYFLQYKMYPQLERIFDRLEETRQSVLAFSAEGDKEVPIMLIPDPKVAEEAGRKIFEAFSEETAKMESQTEVFTFAQNAYLLANILSARLPEQGLILDSSLVSSAIIYFKEVVRRADIENTGEMISFVENFKKNPAARRFAEENPELFRNYLNSPDLKEILDNLVRNLLGKTRFDEANLLAETLKGMISFTALFKDHLGSLKENGFFVEAIEMAEKLQLTEALTEELKIEAFRTLMTDYAGSQVKANFTRLRNFCNRHEINCIKLPKLTEEVSEQLVKIEKINPEIESDLNRLYTLLGLERQKQETFLFNPLKLFEPALLFFGWIFNIFIRIIMAIASRTSRPAQENNKKKANVKAES